MSKEKTEKNLEPEIPGEGSKAEETHVVVEMPEEVVIKLVQENLVKTYENLVWLFNAASSLAVGLWTAFFTTELKIPSSLFFSALAFTIMSLVLIVLMVKNRRAVFANPVRKRLKITEFHR